MRATSIALAIFFAPFAAHCQEAPKPPAPGIGVIAETPDGLAVTATFTQRVAVTQAFTAIENGRAVVRQRTIEVPQTFQRQLRLADADLFDLGGNKVELKSLRRGSKVAVSADDRPVDFVHVKELRGVAAIAVGKPVLP